MLGAALSRREERILCSWWGWGGVVKEGFYGYCFVNILKKRTVVRSGFFCLSVTVTCTFGILPPLFLFEIK